MPIKEITIRDSDVVDSVKTKKIPVCGFCNQEYPEKTPEFLNRVVVNPKPPQNVSEDVVIKQDKSFNTSKEVARALSECSFIDYQKKQVMEGDPVWSDDDKMPRLGEASMSINKDKIAYNFMVEVNQSLRSEGEIEVCDYCKKQLLS